MAPRFLILGKAYMLALGKNWRQPLVRLAAEFSIVVLGVTIALWADSWVAQRKDHAKEIVRLHALLDNVKETLADLRDERNNSTGAAGALLSLVSRSEVTDEELRGQLRYL